MKSKTASRTAQYMALFRAIENRRPAGKRLFTDPLAAHFLDPGLKMLAKISGIPLLGPIVPAIINRKAPGALSSGTARTKYIDDLLQLTVREGVKQVIILGAGYDTRSMRLDFLKNIPVIEIDHPDTSDYKLQKIKALGLQPKTVQYLHIDFNQGGLEQLARENKMNFDLPAVIIWEGVTNYLKQEAIDSTFNFIRKFAHGSFVIFTYVHKEVLDNPRSFHGTEKFFKSLKKYEEEWTWGCLPSGMPGYLVQFNLQLLEDKGAAEYREKYIPGRKGYLRGYEFYRVALAKRTD